MGAPRGEVERFMIEPLEIEVEDLMARRVEDLMAKII